MSDSDIVEAKLRHMVKCLHEYADAIEEGRFEAAHEAAEKIGSEDGEGCSICEHLSSSLSASVAYAMWYPDEAESEQITREGAERARRHAKELDDEIPTPPPGG